MGKVCLFLFTLVDRYGGKLYSTKVIKYDYCQKNITKPA